MKRKVLSKIYNVIAFLSLAVTILNVNSTCEYLAYQPKLPTNAKKLRKF